MLTPPAALAFVNGAVHTMDPRRPSASAVAVREGRIAVVGTDDEVRDQVGPRTEVIDLRGRALLPGFQDAHVHPPSGGLEMLECDLNPGNTRSEYEAIVAEHAAARPDDPWIFGGGWKMSAFPRGTPSKEILDAIVSDRPAFLTNRDGHGAWVNSRALELAGVTAETVDPPDGRVERDADGEPSGTLHEGAMDFVERLIPPTSTDRWIEGLRVAQAYLHSLGITGWQDASVGPGSYDTLDAYLTLAGRGELTARVVAALWWDRHRGEEQVDDLLAQRERGRAPRFRATSVKIMQDGVVETYTAAMLRPYLDAQGHPTDNHGLSFVDAEALKRYVTRLDDEGFQVHFHAIGDRAVREALDAIATAREANGPSDHRHHIAHIQVIHPDDLPRFRRLGVVANGQPLWANYESQMTELTLPFIGPKRAAWQYPFGSLARDGATLAFGSDWSVSSPNPFQEMHVAVNRKVWAAAIAEVGDRRAIDEVFLPQECVDLPTAVRAFTMGSAFVNHLDDVTGSIEVGKYADLVVLDRDPFALPVAELYRTGVDFTVVEGAVVHESKHAAD